MSGDLIAMARSGVTLLPGEARKVAVAYDKLFERVKELEADRAALQAKVLHLEATHERSTD